MSVLRPFGHLGLKALAIALAILIWLVVAGEDVVERGLRVPVQFEQLPADMEFVGEPPTLVDVRVRGAASIVGRMSPGDVVAILDLRAATSGRRLFQLTPEQVRVPFGVEVVQVTPATIAISFERSAVGVVPVVPVVEGDPAPGFVVSRITSDPPKVEVVGPQSAVGRATEALTETITIDGARATITQSVIVGLPSASLRLRTPGRASITVQIMPGPRERTVRGRPVQLRNLSRTLTAYAVPAVVDVVLRGREGLERMAIDQLVTFADLSRLGQGKYSITVQATAPPDAGIVQIVPAVVEVTISSAVD
jgi:YbbR domain-containing protein